MILEAVDRVCEAARPWARIETLAETEAGPVRALWFGTGEPTLIVVAGVHGLEEIGTHIALAYLQSLLVQLPWDDVLKHALTQSRIVVVPALNPVGLSQRRRGNHAGVDLMRNAPVHPSTTAAPFLGGQRLSPRLPWFGGYAEMEPEARGLVDLVDRILAHAPFALALDLHSGYGWADRLWFPYARAKQPIAQLAEVYALRGLLDATLANHMYIVEPTALGYTIAGDLWDHIYDRAHAQGKLLVPLTLEMGSWSWVRKNPLQLFSRRGHFNPVVPHRLRRTLRRHLPLLDFLLRVTVAHTSWSRISPVERDRLDRCARDEWYP